MEKFVISVAACTQTARNSLRKGKEFSLEMSKESDSKKRKRDSNKPKKNQSVSFIETESDETDSENDFKLSTLVKQEDKKSSYASSKGQSFNNNEIKCMLYGIFKGLDNAQVSDEFSKEFKGGGRSKQSLKSM
jgi:hypothetical protein